MPNPGTETERFAALLSSDAKLAEACGLLERAGATKASAMAAELRESVARALQKIQDATYEKITKQRRGAARKAARRSAR